MRKSDVETRRGKPTINVKASGFGYRLACEWEAEGYPEEAIERALRFAWDSHCECFWEEADSLASELLGQRTKVAQEGRSGGWLTVSGLPDVDSWDAVALGKWSRFAKSICANLEHYTSPETIRETIEANEWLPDLEADRRSERWSAEYRPEA